MMIAAIMNIIVSIIMNIITIMTTNRVSGIIFPLPKTMQFDEYQALAKSWKDRKQFLRSELDRLRGKQYIQINSKKIKRLSDEEKMLKEKDDKKSELNKQKQILIEMAFEESYTRKFYKAEMLLCLKERR